jgi:hypothetical protein
MFLQNITFAGRKRTREKGAVRVLFCGYLDIAQIRSVTDVSAQHVVKQAEVRTALEKRDKVL